MVEEDGAVGVPDIDAKFAGIGQRRRRRFQVQRHAERPREQVHGSERQHAERLVVLKGEAGRERHTAIAAADDDARDFPIRNGLFQFVAQRVRLDDADIGTRSDPLAQEVFKRIGPVPHGGSGLGVDDDPCAVHAAIFGGGMDGDKLFRSRAASRR